MMTNNFSSRAQLKTTEQELQEAVALHQAGELREAEKRYRAILQAEPAHPKANHNLGALYVQQGQAADGLPFFVAALEADPAHGQFWLSYIDALFQADQVDSAKAVLALARQSGLQGEEVDKLALRLKDTAPAQQPAGLQPSQLQAPLAAAGGESEPSSQEVDHLVSLFHSGNFAHAANLAGDMTVRFPGHWLGWKMLGVLFSQMGRYPESLAPLQKTIELLPEDPESHNNLGITLQRLGRPQEAAASYRNAVRLLPNYAQAHNNLGSVLLESGFPQEAEDSYRRAVEADPAYVKAYNNLASVLSSQRRWQEAEACYRRVTELDEGSAHSHFNLGNILKEMERLDEAETCYRRALQIDPEYVDAHNNLGSVLLALGRPLDAEGSYRRAIRIDGNCAEAYSNLGNTLVRLERFDEAEACLQQAIRIKPDFAQAYNNLGGLFRDVGRFHEAESCYRRAQQIDGGMAEFYNNLGVTLMDMGRMDEAGQSVRQAIQLKPDYFTAHSNLLFMMNYSSDTDAAAGLAEARQYGLKVSAAAKARYTEWSCPSNPPRLRVGLVSGDFRNHPVGHFLESVLSHLDQGNLELFAYPTLHESDDLTNRIKPHFGAWQPIYGMNDEAAARLIHDDKLHVLIDLSGHTGHNRLPVFAWKPAPIQVSWQGYLATTGVPEMDYFLGDPHVAPSSEAGHFTERIWQLPECYMCFTQPDVELDVAPLPALANGHITFGSLNNLAKMSDATVALWARVLQAAPDSRLLLKTRQLSSDEIRESVLHRYAQHGIGADRLILESGGRQSRTEYLATYHRVDIALDPFPYSGCTTSIEGLWMGVPLLTRRGDRFESHVGETIDHNAGLSDWIAADEDDYVAKAIAFSSDLERLSALRAGLRKQVVASPLFDADRFARHFEQALWGMWNEWLQR